VISVGRQDEYYSKSYDLYIALATITYQTYLCCCWISTNIRICARSPLENTSRLSKYFPITQSYLEIRQQILFWYIQVILEIGSFKFQSKKNLTTPVGLEYTLSKILVVSVSLLLSLSIQFILDPFSNRL